MLNKSTKSSSHYFDSIHLLTGISIIVVLWGCNQKKQNRSVKPASLSLHFEQELIIGGDENLAHKPLLVKPSKIRTDREGTIYIVDSRLSKIQVFDANGNFQRSIGGAGDGPGEFRVINAIDINSNNPIDNP